MPQGSCKAVGTGRELPLGVPELRGCLATGIGSQRISPSDFFRRELGL